MEKAKTSRTTKQTNNNKLISVMPNYCSVSFSFRGGKRSDVLSLKITMTREFTSAKTNAIEKYGEDLEK